MAFASISSSLLEDSMEVSSSPANGPFDADIDLDENFGDYDGVQIVDDDRMHEDGDPARPGTATDEDMGDADQNITVPLTEEVMRDDDADLEFHEEEIHDEDLIDYDDAADYQDQVDSDFGAVPAQHDPVAYEAQTVIHANDADIVHQLDEPTSENTNITTEETVIGVDRPSAEANTTNTAADNGEGIDGPNYVEANTHETLDKSERFEQPVLQNERLNDSFGLTGQGAESRGSKPSSEDRYTLSTDVVHVADGPPTPTDTGLHPMRVQFDGHEMPLFKSHKQPDGLLKDDNLVSVSLADFLQNCRRRLQFKLGVDCINESQELLLKFDQLGGLVLLEGSRGASETSLNDVFDVFMQLHENEGADVPPFALYLSASGKFTDSLSALRQAAAEGKSASALFRHSVKAPQDSLSEGANTRHTGSANDNEQDVLANEVHQHGDTNDENSFHDEEAYVDGTDGQELEDFDEYGEDDYVEGQYEGDEDDTSLGHSQYHDTDPTDEATRLEGDNDQDQEISLVGDHASTLEWAEHTVGAQGDDPITSVSEADESLVTYHNGTEKNSTGEFETWDFFKDDVALIDGGIDTAADHRSQTSRPLTQTDSNGIEGLSGNDQKNAVVASTSSSTEEKSHPVISGNDSCANVPTLNSDTLAPAEEVHEIFSGHQDQDRGDENSLDDDYQYEDLNQEDLALLDEHKADDADVNDDESDQPAEDSEQFQSAHDLECEGKEQIREASASIDQNPLRDERIDDDDIGYEDDNDFGDGPLVKSAGSSNSPLGKRSFNEHMEENLFDFEASESKRIRPDFQSPPRVS